jgi:hypothetical protein
MRDPEFKPQYYKDKIKQKSYYLSIYSVPGNALVQQRATQSQL